MHHKLSYLVAQWIAGLYSVSEVDVLGTERMQDVLFEKVSKRFLLESLSNTGPLPQNC